MLIFYLIIVVCAAIGFSICLHIDWAKRHNHKIVCPTESDCEMVIHSSFSTWQGIPWEDLGLIYYALVFVSYFGLILIPGLATNLFLTLLILPTLLATFTAGYLIYIQGKILKEWCTLCLLSSLMCFSIFLSTLAIWF